MNTQEATDTLTTASQNLGAQITLATTQKEAFDIAVAQLKGLLDTPSADLVTANRTAENLTAELDAATAVIETLTTERHSLTEILNLKEEEHAGIISAKNLELENAIARIAELEAQLRVKEPVPAEEGGGVG